MLNEFEIAILISLCKATKTSKSAHIPQPYFMKKFQNQKKLANKALHSLIALGYVVIHPTRGDTTYDLTEEGINICRILRKSAYSYTDLSSR